VLTWQAIRARMRQFGVMGIMACLVAALLARYQHEFEHSKGYGDNRWPFFAMLENLELKSYDERMRRRGRRHLGRWRHPGGRGLQHRQQLLRFRESRRLVCDQRVDRQNRHLG